MNQQLLQLLQLQQQLLQQLLQLLQLPQIHRSSSPFTESCSTVRLKTLLFFTWTTQSKMSTLPSISAFPSSSAVPWPSSSSPLSTTSVFRVFTFSSALGFPNKFLATLDLFSPQSRLTPSIMSNLQQTGLFSLTRESPTSVLFTLESVLTSSQKVTSIS